MTTRTPIRVGTDRLPVDLKRMPNATFTAIYNPPGHGLKTPIPALPSRVRISVSYNDQPNAALLNPFLDSLTRSIDLIWDKEEEGDFPAAVIKANHRLQQELVDAHHNGHWVRTVECFTDYAQTHHKVGPHGESTNGRDLYSCSDAVAVDIYQDHGLKAYPSSADFCGEAVQLATDLGVDLILREFGRQPIPAIDPDGALAGAAYAADLRYLASLSWPRKQGAGDNPTTCYVTDVGLWDNGGCSLTGGSIIPPGDRQLDIVNGALVVLAA